MQLACLYPDQTNNCISCLGGKEWYAPVPQPKYQWITVVVQSYIRLMEL